MSSSSGAFTFATAAHMVIEQKIRPTRENTLPPATASSSRGVFSFATAAHMVIEQKIRPAIPPAPESTLPLATASDNLQALVYPEPPPPATPMPSSRGAFSFTTAAKMVIEQRVRPAIRTARESTLPLATAGDNLQALVRKLLPRASNKDWLRVAVDLTMCIFTLS